VESLLDRVERVCIVDPTGVWFGVKSKASGKSGAYPIVVFGGEHADIPLGQAHGETIAQGSASPDKFHLIERQGSEEAGNLCQEGPTASKPYDHQLLLDHIRRSRAARDRNR
jgi:hypothetical protein